MVKIVLVTCPPDRANEIAGHLLRERVCACVSVVPAVQSRYWWEGELETAEESLLIVKCASDLVDTVVEKVKEVHPYKVPEIVALPTEGGNLDYLSWVREAPRTGGASEGSKERARPAAGAARKAEVATAEDFFAALEKLPGGAAKPADRKTAMAAAGAVPLTRPASEAPALRAGAVTQFISAMPAAPKEVRETVGKMRIVLLGPPGAGKGTQARLLAARYGMQHLSAGDIIIREVRSGTSFGQRVQQFTKTGHLVPDEEVNAIILKSIGALGDNAGFVLEGFPRTPAQAQALEAAARPDFVFYINAPQEVLIDRLTKRSYCDCGASFGPSKQPARAGICDECGSKLYQREDDQPRHVLTRLDEYNVKTRELLRFFRDRLRPVDGSLALAEVHRQMCRHLERSGG
jgi:adenylate kinase